jgi:hypothetical protein
LFSTLSWIIFRSGYEVRTEITWYLPLEPGSTMPWSERNAQTNAYVQTRYRSFIFKKFLIYFFSERSCLEYWNELISLYRSVYEILTNEINIYYMYINTHPYTIIFYMYSTVCKVGPCTFRSWGSRVGQEVLKVQNTETCKAFLRAVVHFSNRTESDFLINYTKKPDWLSAIMDMNASFFILIIPLPSHTIELWNETDIGFLYYVWWDPWKKMLI